MARKEDLGTFVGGNLLAHLGKELQDPPWVHVDSIHAILALKGDAAVALYLSSGSVVCAPVGLKEVVARLEIVEEGLLYLDLTGPAGFPVWVRYRCLAAIPLRGRILLTNGTEISHRDNDPGMA